MKIRYWRRKIYPMLVVNCGKRLRVAVLVLVCMSASVLAESRREVDVESHIAGLLSSKGGYSWVETGRIDLDGDGVQDLLLNAHKKKGEPTSSTWYVYLRDGARYHFPLPETKIRVYRYNMEYRRIRGSGNQKVLVSYVSMPERENFIFADWYRRIDDSRYERIHERVNENDLLPPEEGDIVSSFTSGDEWSERGTNVRAILENYTQYDADTYDGDKQGTLPGFDLGERVDIDERISWFLNVTGGPDWVETGQLDLDGDGDLDFLLNAQYGEPKRASRWSAFLNRGGEYFVFASESVVPLPRDSLEFRRVKGYDGRKVLVWHDSRADDGDLFRAYSYSKEDDGSYRRSMALYGDGFLLPSREDEIVSSFSEADKASRGMDVEKVMPNYARHFSNNEGEIFSLYRLDVNAAGAPVEGEKQPAKGGNGEPRKSAFPWGVIGSIGAFIIALGVVAFTQRSRLRSSR